MKHRGKNNIYLMGTNTKDGDRVDLNIEKYRYRAFIAFMCIVLLAVPQLREMLERHMISHMLIQLPLLTLCGFWIGIYFKKVWRINIQYSQALPLLLIALFTAMFWMLPRVLDSSIEHIGYIIAKFLSLPLLLGIPLAFSWKHIGFITKAFLLSNIISMLIVLAWLYIEAPVRLCNYYLIGEQKLLGVCLLYIAGLLTSF